MTTKESNEEAVLAEVAEMIRGIIGEEWIQTAAIGRESTFSKDLELESIEIVALAEKVQERWGEHVDFPGWLSEMDLDQIIGITVGQLVARIVDRMPEA